jgi:hypothetical protein
MFIRLPLWQDPTLNYGGVTYEVLVNTKYIASVYDSYVNLVGGQSLRTNLTYAELVARIDPEGGV